MNRESLFPLVFNGHGDQVQTSEQDSQAPNLTSLQLCLPPPTACPSPLWQNMVTTALHITGILPPRPFPEACPCPPGPPESCCTGLKIQCPVPAPPHPASCTEGLASSCSLSAHMGYKPLRPEERFKCRWAIILETFLDDYSPDI